MGSVAPDVIRVLTRRDMESAEVYPVARGAVAVFTAPSPARDGDNEDAAAVIPVDATRAILAVADGLGGQRSGAEAAEVALKTVIGCVSETRTSNSNLRSGLLDGFEHGLSR